MSEATTLALRRAIFVYEGARLAAIASEAPVVPIRWENREIPFRSQFLEVIDRQCSENRSTSPEELHASWMLIYYKMGWVCGKTYDRFEKHHPDLVPYNLLHQLEKDKDTVFIMLCEIARRYIY